MDALGLLFSTAANVKSGNIPIYPAMIPTLSSFATSGTQNASSEYQFIDIPGDAKIVGILNNTTVIQGGGHGNLVNFTMIIDSIKYSDTSAYVMRLNFFTPDQMFSALYTYIGDNTNYYRVYWEMVWTSDKQMKVRETISKTGNYNQQSVSVSLPKTPAVFVLFY